VPLEVGEEARVGERGGDLALVGLGVKIPARARIAAGDRVEPEE
jgi:hypothetical protein